jgi:hypothetical protein
MAELSPFCQLILALFTDQCRASYNEVINLPPSADLCAYF